MERAIHYVRASRSLAVGEIGSPDRFLACDLKTGVREDVYVRGPDRATAISQAEGEAKEEMNQRR